MPVARGTAVALRHHRAGKNPEAKEHRRERFMKTAAMGVTAMWSPRQGACPTERGFRFEIWAPTHERVELLLHPSTPQERRVPLAASYDGLFVTRVDDARPDDRYAYLLDAAGPFPDPASRYQPDGVHGSSAIVDPRSYTWSDGGWRGIALEEAIIYELHVGTFSPEGTFAGVTTRLPYLADLGITVLELMPVADFPGQRNWGYDGVSLFSPARCYGTPDDLRRLVDTAHRLGLAVVLDVVYNHFVRSGRRVPDRIQSALSLPTPSDALGHGRESRRRPLGSGAVFLRRERTPLAARISPGRTAA
jgi:1,4-alpha-glucan branching enzyme